MKNTVAIMWTVAVIAAVIGPGAAWRSYAKAHGRAQEETHRLVMLEGKGAELARLRTAAPRWSVRAPDEGSLAPRVTEALTSAGVPASILVALAPQIQTIATPAGARMVRRSAAVTIGPITLPKLGTFLDTWRSAEPGWVVSSIEVAPDLDVAAIPGADRPLRVNLTLESLAAEAVGGIP